MEEGKRQRNKLTSISTKTALRRERIRQLNLEDDMLYGEVVKDKYACQDVLRVLLGKASLKVANVIPQYAVKNAFNRSVFLDVLATEDKNDSLNEGQPLNGSRYLRNYFNVEMQKNDYDDHLRRARYHAGAVDTNTFEKGTDFWELSDLYVVFITKSDFLSLKKPLGLVRRIIKNTDIEVDNGVYEVYANTQTHPGASGPVYDLLQYIRDTTRERERDDFPNLVKRVNYLKYDEEGVKIMGNLLELEREEGRIEGRIELILNTLEELGDVPESIKESIQNEKDMERLKRLIKLAVLAGNMDEFSKRIKEI